MKFSIEWQILWVPGFWCFSLQILIIRQILRGMGDVNMSDVKLEWCLNSNINNFPFRIPDVDGGCDVASPTGPYERCETARPLKSWIVRETLPRQKQQRWKKPNSNLHPLLQQEETWSASHIPFAVILAFCDSSASLAWCNRTGRGECVKIQRFLDNSSSFTSM